MKYKLLATFLVAIMLVTCLFTMTACGGLSDWLKDKDDKTDQTQTDDTNNDTNDDDDDDDDTPVVYSFATDSWETIAELSANGEASTAYNIGDEKVITLSTDEVITLVIYGFNHDTLSDGTGLAGITIGMKDLLQTTSVEKPDGTIGGGWGYSIVRNEFLPTVFDELPEALQSVIKTVDKYCKITGSSNTHKTEDKLFIPSLKEISNVSGIAEDTQYEYWKTFRDGTKAENRIMKLGGTGTATAWHYRQWYARASFGWISETGASTTGAIGDSGLVRGVSFAFCV